MAWPSLDLRDGLLLLVALAAIYLMVLLLRLVRIGRRSARNVFQEEGKRLEPAGPLRQREEPEAKGEPAMSASRAMSAYAAAEYAVEAAQEAPVAEPFAVPPAPTFDWEDVKELFSETPQQPAAGTPATAQRSGFGEHLADHLARSDVEMEVQRMRDEMERMRAEIEELRAVRRVSPQYAEAMELAQRGLTAQDVADRLGISLGEAELVHALSRGGKNFDEGENHGADTNATGAGRFDGFDRHRAG